VPGIAGIHQLDRDLGVLDPPGGAGVLALHPDRLAALLEIAGLVDDQRTASTITSDGKRKPANAE
jgi:hypothetical protein